MFKKIKDIIDKNNINFVLILSPPRTCSTILEKSISTADEVLGHINEPWSQYDKKAYPKRTRTEYTLIYIYTKLAQLINQNDGKKRTIVVKDISYFIPMSDVFAKYALLFDKIILLARNPILSVESLLSVLLSTSKYYISMQYLNKWAEFYHYPSWEVLEKEVSVKRSFAKIELFIDDYSRKIESVLDEDEFKSANLFISEKFPCCINQIYSTWLSGWFSLAYHHQQLKDLNKNFFALDATLLRLAPNSVLNDVSNYLEISFSSLMTCWKGAASVFDKGYDKVNGFTPFFDKALQSEKFFPPDEEIICLENLPIFYQNYFLNKKISPYNIYIELLRGCLGSLTAIKEIVSVHIRRLLPRDPILTYLLCHMLELQPSKKDLDIERHSLASKKLLDIINLQLNKAGE